MSVLKSNIMIVHVFVYGRCFDGFYPRIIYKDHHNDKLLELLFPTYKHWITMTQESLVSVLSAGFSLKLNTIKGFNKTKTLLKTLNVFVLIFWNTCVISLQPTVFDFFFALSLDTTVVPVWYYCILLTLVCLFLKIHITDRSWSSKNDSLIFKRVLK